MLNLLTILGLSQKIYDRILQILETTTALKSRFNGTNDDIMSFELKGNESERITLANIPTYLPEWIEKGCAREFFLGAIIYAKMTFASDTAPKRHIVRQDYNEIGPVVASSLD